LTRKELIAIAMHDQRARGNGREVRPREVHVVITVLELMELLLQGLDLLITMLVITAVCPRPGRY